MTKRIFILNGHPAPTSLVGSLASAYAEAADTAGHEVRVKHLHDMTFDPVHEVGGYASNKPLEPILEEVLGDLEWCQHLTLASPMWWGGVPAKLKGVFDRAFIPGRTFNPRETTMIGLPKPMLTGRSARVILTSDSPSFFLRLAYGNAIKRQLSGQILGFVGFKPVKYSYFAPASDVPKDTAERWLDAVRACAKAGA